MVMSEAIRKMLRGNASSGEIKAQAIAEGMITMKQDGMRKAKEGITCISEVMKSVFSIS
jgi:type II secretory ATPase GspE/PulE/Tfp pilus assembly ATPase PilB-like protein